MFWNYQIIEDENGYGLFEVFKDKEDDIPHSWTAEPITGYYDSVIDLIEDIESMVSDADNRPILNMKKLKEYERKSSIL